MLLGTCKDVAEEADTHGGDIYHSCCTADGAQLLSCNVARADEGTDYDNFPHAQTMANFPPASHDLFNFDQLLSKDEKDVKYRTRAYMVLLLLTYTSYTDICLPLVRHSRSKYLK